MFSQQETRAAEGFEQFWSRVHKTDTCWLWTGSHQGDGYGRFYAQRKMQSAHRYSYELHVGPIPAGLQIDHLCRVPGCVNPAHLEAVTPRENTLRGQGITAVQARRTHCPKGHPYDEENTRLNGRKRFCRACQALVASTYLARRKRGFPSRAVACPSCGALPGGRCRAPRSGNPINPEHVARAKAWEATL